MSLRGPSAELGFSKASLSMYRDVGVGGVDDGVRSGSGCPNRSSVVDGRHAPNARATVSAIGTRPVTAKAVRFSVDHLRQFVEAQAAEQ